VICDNISAFYYPGTWLIMTPNYFFLEKENKERKNWPEHAIKIITFRLEVLEAFQQSKLDLGSNFLQTYYHSKIHQKPSSED
jgi:hypothetical protein